MYLYKRLFSLLQAKRIVRLTNDVGLWVFLQPPAITNYIFKVEDIMYNNSNHYFAYPDPCPNPIRGGLFQASV